MCNIFSDCFSECLKYKQKIDFKKSVYMTNYYKSKGIKHKMD